MIRSKTVYKETNNISKVSKVKLQRSMIFFGGGGIYLLHGIE